MAYLLKAAHAIDPQLHLDDICDVLIEDGKITQIGKDLAAPKDACVIDAAGKYLVPSRRVLGRRFTVVLPMSLPCLTPIR